MKNYIIASSMAIVVGCAFNGLPEGYHKDTPQGIEDQVEKVFVPVLVEGSAVRLNEDWLISAAHNKSIFSIQGREVYYHLTCDVALIRDHKEGVKTKVGSLDIGGSLFVVGYPSMISLMSHKGKHVGNLTIPETPCIYGATNATTIGGMSGGGVYNISGELIGIVRGVALGVDNPEAIGGYANPTIFTYLENVEDWVEEITGESLYE